jgi:hypothetical protein
MAPFSLAWPTATSNNQDIAFADRLQHATPLPAKLDAKLWEI